MPFTEKHSNLEQIRVSQEWWIKDIDITSYTFQRELKNILMVMSTQIKVKWIDTPGKKITASKGCRWVRGQNMKGGIN